MTDLIRLARWRNGGPGTGDNPFSDLPVVYWEYAIPEPTSFLKTYWFWRQNELRYLIEVGF